jgi:hypothetical protein
MDCRGWRKRWSGIRERLLGEDPWEPWIFFEWHGWCPSPCFALFGSLPPTRFTTYFHAKREWCVHFERSICSASNEVKASRERERQRQTERERGRCCYCFCFIIIFRCFFYFGSRLLGSCYAYVTALNPNFISLIYNFIINFLYIFPTNSACIFDKY